MPRRDRRIALALAALGILLLLATAGFVLVAGRLTQRTGLLLAAGLALVALYALVDPRTFAALVRQRRARPRSVTVILGAAVAGVLAGGNVLASGANQALDLTRTGQHTLSPQSVAATRRLTSDLQVTGYFRPADARARRDAQDLLDLYRRQSPHVQVRYVDPDRDPAQALRLGATVTGSLVLQYQSRTPVVLQTSQETEAGITGAILRLESSRSPSVCWAVGDGERDLKDTNQLSGYSAAADMLQTSDYQSRTVAPGDRGALASCDVLAVVQLGSPLSPDATSAIQSYLNGGGKLLIAVDPWLDPAITASADAVVQPYGAGFDGGLVIEPDPAHAAADDTTVPVVADFGDSPITRDLGGQYVFFPQTTAVTGTGIAGSTSVALASTTDQAFAIPSERTSLAHRTGDRAGPFALMRSIELRHGAVTTRIILAGTSALAENRAMPPAVPGANAALLLASLDWLTAQEPAVAVPSRPADAVPLALGDLGLRVNVVLAAALLPLLMVAAGALLRVRHGRPR